MIDAKSWFDNGIKALRLEHCAEKSSVIQAEIDNFLNELSYAIGAQLAAGSHSTYLNSLNSIMTEYTVAQAQKAAQAAPVPRPTRPTTLTEIELEGAELRAARIRLKLKQIDFAQEVGVSNNTISLWERGEQKMTEADKAKVAAFIARAQSPAPKK